MLGRLICQAATQAMRQSGRMMSTKRSSINGKGALDSAYKVFMKSTPVYVTTVLLAALMIEGVYGSATNYIWETTNRGRLYHHVDWSKFAEKEEEEEEEEVEEAEEEEEVEDYHQDNEEEEG